MRHSPIASPSTVLVADPPPAAAQPNPPAAGGLRKVQFGKIAAKKDESTKKSYPVFPDQNNQAGVIAQRIRERSAQLEALEGALKTDKAELKMLVTPHYFTVNHGRHEVPSSISVKTIVLLPDGTPDPKHRSDEVLVSFQNRYPMLPDEAPLVGVLGDRVGNFFRQSFELKITGDLLPGDKTQELMDELQALFEKYNATNALEVKSGVKPTSDFHEKRHLQLDVQQNLAVEQVCPVVAMVKTNGRK